MLSVVLVQVEEWAVAKCVVLGQVKEWVVLSVVLGQVEEWVVAKCGIGATASGGVGCC